ncbi:MAG: hypothetical protein AB8F78_16055 [Saprospiraceae bacterium]
MIKLLFWAIIGAIVYFWYRGQQAITARKESELEAFRDARKTVTEDVEVEIIEIKPRENRP